MQRSQTTRPSSRRSVSVATGSTAAVGEGVDDADPDRDEQDDEHRREDEEDHREEHLQRHLLGCLLRRGAPALPHLEREAAQGGADRDAEALALDERTDEEAHVGRVRTPAEALERLAEREAHALLLEREPDRKSTRLNSSHQKISYAVFCLK